jgi:glycosyltransferase involved in cell wall biosynthesis
MLVENKKIFGVILSHNCEHFIDQTLSRIPENIFDKIIVSDDGSIDNSVGIYRKLGYDVYETSTAGYGSNIRNGLMAAFKDGADYVVEIHGDGAQFDPYSVIGAKDYIEEGVDLILGSRFMKKGRARELGMPLLRFLANRGLSFIDRIILNKNLSEFHTGFRVYKKSLMKVYSNLFSDDHICSFQIIAATIAKRLSVKEIEVECDYRREHTSHSYAGATKYAILHFGVLLQFLLSKYIKLDFGVFKNE